MNRPQQPAYRPRNLDSFLEERLQPTTPGTMETAVPAYVDVPADVPPIGPPEQ